MSSHGIKVSSSAAVRRAVPAALCAAGLMGAWLAAAPVAAQASARTAAPLTVVRAATVKPAAFSYPYPYDSFTPQSSLWNIYPYKVNGTLFFSNNGGNYVCSATSVAGLVQ